MARASRRRRSLAAVRGWKTRRANARARSLAAKRGWKTRRKTFRLTRERDRKKHTRAKRPLEPTPAQTGELRDYLISLSYYGRKGSRHVDYAVTAVSDDDAIEQLHEEQPWTQKIPWSKITIAAGPVSRHERGTVQTRLELAPKKRKSSRRAKTKSR